jgi:flagellar protein FlgJ
MTIAVSTTAPAAPSAATATNPALASTVKHLAGMLWYEMLSEMNKSGFGSDTLGTGGDGFQSMFMWDVAQNDFAKYDTAISAATIRQIGGAGAAAGGSGAGPAPASPAAASATTAMPPAGTADIADNSGSPGAVTVQQATSFAKSIWPNIVAAAKQLNVSPVAVLAQTALETGWGAATAGNNLFGIKAADGQAGTARPTHEVVDGVLTAQTASFRDYGSPADSVSDYVDQIQSAFQGVVGQTSVGGFATALQQGGYATDTSYASKIISISQSPLMQQVLQSVQGQTSDAPNE